MVKSERELYAIGGTVIKGRLTHGMRALNEVMMDCKGDEKAY